MAKSVGMFQRPVEFKVNELSHEVVVLNIDYEYNRAVYYTTSSGGDIITLRCSQNNQQISGPAFYIYNVTIKNTKISGTYFIKGTLRILNDGFWKIYLGEVYSKNYSEIENISHEDVYEVFSCNMAEPHAFMNSVMYTYGKLYPEHADLINAENNLKNYFISINNRLNADKYIPVVWII